MVKRRIMRVTEKDLDEGDHIYVRRKGLLYSHHGIYAGNGAVIHFKGAVKEKKDPVVIITDMHDFLNGGKLRRRKHKKRLASSETLRIARAHLSEKGYSLPFNNCEHFVTYWRCWGYCRYHRYGSRSRFQKKERQEKAGWFIADGNHSGKIS